MAANPRQREEMEMDFGDGPDDEGAESSYGLTFTAEDAAVRGDRDVVLPSNLLSMACSGAPLSTSTMLATPSSRVPTVWMSRRRVSLRRSRWTKPLPVAHSSPPPL
jgi:hypothetical protein